MDQVSLAAHFAALCARVGGLLTKHQVPAEEEDREMPTTTLEIADIGPAWNALQRRLANAESIATKRMRLVIINGKGGVGKSSMAAAIAVTCASIGRKVALVELDPQGNNAEDLGFLGTEFFDNGQAQVDAILNGKRLVPTGMVRDNLYVIPGGDLLEQIVEELYIQKRAYRDYEDPLSRDAWMGMYAAALEDLDEEFDLVILDVAPGYETLQLQALTAGDMVIIPAKSDPSSRKGLRTVARRMVQARVHNPSIAFLGVALFGVNSSARRVLGNIREYFEGDLKGIAEVFSTAIRHVEAAAVACRTNGLVPQELAERTDRGVDPSVMNSVVNLAKDYRSLAIEVLSTISKVNSTGGSEQ
ncbi:ParA family protein [Streptomyces sp. NPDC002553]|uniref:ParA family protein n=1 Tax=Streptomyces sp. NPDC002553 TaxID=3154417 RepID=UPI00332614D2